MRLTRQQLLAGAAASALGAGGIYELVDQLSDGAPVRVPSALPRPDEQHLLESVSVIVDNEVEVVVPPMHHQLVTANVGGGDVRAAQRDLSDALAELDARYEQTPAGLGVTAAVLRKARPRGVARTRTVRPPRAQVGVAARRSLSERPG